MVMAPSGLERQLNGLVNRELQGMGFEAHAPCRWLGRPIVFLRRPGHLVVLDTSALMEWACSSRTSIGPLSTGACWRATSG